MGMKENTVYNQYDNAVYVKTDGDKINIICNKENQMQKVISKMTNRDCIFEGYEEWDEEEDMKWILTFRVLDEYENYPDIN
jgi:hypothetical protein|tara:strand:- start:1280 stop:1522 length:243 start_codon:yes stop_codon:yes gene_type:complete